MNKVSRIKSIIGKGFAALCSLIIPGLGQLLRQEWQWAIGLFCFPILVNIILQQIGAYDYSIIYKMWVLLNIGIHVFSAVHAYMMDSVAKSKIYIFVLFFTMIQASFFASYASKTAEWPFRYMLIDEAEAVDQPFLEKDEVLIFRRDDHKPKEEELWVFKDFKGDFLLRKVSKNDAYGLPFGRPLYILWSPDKARMDQRFNKKAE